ncbi:hypothetical protein Pcinc_042958 [Petrolisthes cinctipes]|uniref:MYND-type domain-containing protein n=1 Tax=Petrolisthes cinctipes TaxID=88211 RepID=A0AAE1EGI9_PETCI|nr:hypothetical protein Pcinc_042958 [Petrolisthes cinctipes]
MSVVLVGGGKGKGRSLAAGDVILKAEPFVYLLSGSLKGLYCDYCFKKSEGYGRLQRCSRCKGERYCGRECQVKAWQLIHRHECPCIKRVLPKAPPDTARLMAKIIIKLKNGGDQLVEEVTDGKTRKFKDLMNHYSDIKKDRARQEQLEALTVVLSDYLGPDTLPNTADLQGIFGRICVNSFSITDMDHNALGTGVYLAGSVFDHSCRPNAFVTFNGPTLTCRALQSFTDFDISKVRISYLDVMTSTEERVKELKRRYYFTCDCPGCHDPEMDRLASSVVCGIKGCDGPVYIDENLPPSEPLPPCTKCGCQSPVTHTRTEYLTAAGYCREQLEECKDQYFLDIAQRGLERQGDNLFHPMNLLRVRLLDAATEAAISLSNWNLALQYGIQNIPALRLYYGERHPNVGMTLLKLGKIMLYLQQQQEALEYLTEAEGILNTSHGNTHPLYTTQLAPLITQAREELTANKKHNNRHYNSPHFSLVR